MTHPFTTKRACVTGAASGLGRACAFELAARGAALVLADIDRTRLAATTEELQARGHDVLPIPTDVTDPAQIAALVEAGGDIDILVNNAGVACVGHFEHSTVEDWDWVMAVNLLGPIRLTRAWLPAMLARRSGHIVNIASLAGLVAVPTMTAYTTTKFGLVGFSEALRAEIADRSVHVTVVCPGYIRTNLHAATRYDGQGFVRNLLDRMPDWMGLSPEQAATRIVDAICDREQQITLGPEKLGWWLKRISPAAVSRVMRGVQWAS